MRLYLDTAEVDEIRPLTAWGAFAGVTTDAEMLAKVGLDLQEAIKILSSTQPGDLFVQISGDDPDGLEGTIRALCSVVPSRLMIKLAPTAVGLEVMHRLRDERIWIAARDLMGFGQALLAANAGADVLIPSLARMRRAGATSSMEVTDIVELCKHRGGRPRVMVSDIETIDDLRAAARLGVWAATIPPSLAFELLHGDLITSTLDIQETNPRGVDLGE